MPPKGTHPPMLGQAKSSAPVEKIFPGCLDKYSSYSNDWGERTIRRWSGGSWARKMLNSPVQDFWIGMVLTIRAFRPDDIKDVCRIEEESFRDPWPCYMFTYLHMKNPESIKVAVIDGRLVGYVVVDIEARQKGRPYPEPRGRAGL